MKRGTGYESKLISTDILPFQENEFPTVSHSFNDPVCGMVGKVNLKGIVNNKHRHSTSTEIILV